MRTEKWRAIDIELESTKVYDNPFLDVDVKGVFTGPGGEKLELYGFWNGGNSWKIRFAPTVVGTWKYEIAATDENASLCANGEIECVVYSGNCDIYKHGFLKVGPLGRYLIYDDGTPFFWLGDTHWTFITEERMNESNCPKYESQFKACVDKRVEQKFTVYQSNFRDGKNFSAFGRYLEFLVETDKGFLPDIALFDENIEPKMKYIADAGFVNAVGYSWGGAIVHEGGVERYKALAKYLVARYAAYPIVWTLAGELPGYFGNFTETVNAWREVALVTEACDGYNNLQSVHLATDRPFPGIYQGEKWYDFAMSQAGHGDYDMYQTMYSGYREMYPTCPLVESEGFYEAATSGEINSRVITPAMFRRLAYLNMQCGGAGYTYGCNGVWELQWEAGVGGIGWGDMSWWDGLELPGANQLTIFRDFYESIGWHRMKPINYLIYKEIIGNEHRELLRQGCFTADDEMKIIVGYFQETAMKSVTIRTLPYKSYTAKFFNPETGEYTLITDDARPVEGVWSLPMDRRSFRKMDLLLVLTANV